MAQRNFENANNDRLRAEGEYLAQLNILSKKMVEVAGMTSEPDLSHRKLYSKNLLLMKIHDFAILR